MNETIPERIGKYEVESIAGRGAMGVVYLARDPVLERRVAIKVNTQQGGGDEKQRAFARKLFLNEARAVGALDHPHILRVYEAGEHEGRPYMVMEFIEGVEDLKKYCRAENLLPVERALEIFVQCAEALAHAHEHGIIHRDIKPANIMLNRKGEAKICDFGIAQRTASDQTQLVGWFGSPLYMSPEQARDEPLTFSSDIFSFGVVMYELLTGRQPFQARGLAALIRKITDEEPEPVNAVRPEVPEALALIVKKAMRKDPAQRFPSAAALAEALHKVQSEMLHGGTLTDSQRLELLASLDFFRGLREADLKAVQRVASWRAFGDGETIIEEGEEDSALYVLAQGEVRVSRAGREIASLRAGECFGEMAYLGGGRRSASVITLGETLVIRIESPLKKWASLPVQMQLGQRLQETLIERLDQTSRRLAHALKE